MAGLYIHIPYCHSKCSYCDFFSTPRKSDLSAYVDALLQEWELRIGEIPVTDYRTIYIGGGTPSILPLYELERLVCGLRKSIDLSSLTEFTIEANPEDITPDWISAVKETGINRVSIGVQSFHDSELRLIGRHHDADNARIALRALQSSGLNYSADLIYGLPCQTIEMWRQNLMELLEFHPPHLSAYLLSYEPGTKLYARLQRGTVEEASEELAYNMYELLCYETRNAGYVHYEVSNFALQGYKSHHNSSYWDYTPYLGLGCSAHSFDGTFRRFNPSNIKKYISEIKSGTTAYNLDKETEKNRFNDYVITSLRTLHGISFQFIEQHWDVSYLKRFAKAAAPFLASGKLQMLSLDNCIIPENHWLTSDAILRELIEIE